MNHKAIIEKDNKIINLSDTDKYPCINNEPLNDIYKLKNITNKQRDKRFTYYDYMGIPVPRVSNILDYCSDQSGIISWAASCGKKYVNIRDDALTIGTMVHEAIEKYLKRELDIGELADEFGNDRLSEQACTAFKNFVAWQRSLEFAGFYIEHIYAIEEVMTCPYFGGTCDAIVRINGADYVIDFKTSKYINTSYLIQLSVYYWLINNGYCKVINHVDGIGVIRVDKNTKNKYDDFFLNAHIPWQNESLNTYINTFGSYCNAYYHGINAMVEFNSTKESVSKSIYTTLRGEDVW